MFIIFSFTSLLRANDSHFQNEHNFDSFLFFLLIVSFLVFPSPSPEIVSPHSPLLFDLLRSQFGFAEMKGSNATDPLLQADERARATVFHVMAASEGS